MNAGIRRVAMLLAVQSLCAVMVVAQVADDTWDGAQGAPLEKARRKQPSWFHRPAQETPAEQLKYARELATAGRDRAARGQFRALVHAWHTSPEAPVAQQAYADLLLKAGKYEKAFEEFQYLIDNFSGRFVYRDAVDSQLRIARHVMDRRHFRILGLPGYTAPEDALPLFEKIQRNAPSGSHADEVQFHIATIQEDAGDYTLAADSYDYLRQRYPGSDLAGAAAYRRASCLVRVADNRRNDEASHRDALATLAAFVRDYPDSPDAAVARSEIDRLNEHLARIAIEVARYYERRGRHPRAALLAYSDFLKKFPSSQLAQEASARVLELTKHVEANQ